MGSLMDSGCSEWREHLSFVGLMDLGAGLRERERESVCVCVCVRERK